MSQIFRGLVLLFFLLLSFRGTAQNYYNTPYTRYSIGDLTNSGFAVNKAMGGSSSALRIQNQINYLNPASYTSQDTNSFLFQTAFVARIVNINTQQSSDQSSNMNIDYLAIGFPITSWLNLSAGLVPFSRMQYNFNDVRTIPGVGESTTFEYSGFGGFNEFYLGGALAIKKIFSVGINLNYLFGSLDRTQTSYLTEKTNSAYLKKSSNYIASDFYSKIGVQFHPKIGEKHSFVLGAALDAKADIDVKIKGKTIRYNPISGGKTIFADSLEYSIDTPEPLILPNKFTFGASYQLEKTLVITGEMITQDWSGIDIVQSNFKAGKYQSYRFGADYIPVPLDVRTREEYYKRIHYQLGGYLTKTYLYYNGTNISDKGVTAGLGLPIKNARKLFTGTTFNVAYQFGIRGTTEQGLIKENYHFITFGLTLHDFWFLKPKYD